MADFGNPEPTNRRTTSSEPQTAAWRGLLQHTIAGHRGLGRTCSPTGGFWTKTKNTQTYFN
eukprot:5967659-Pyramimonas_sp.AAC.1